MFLDLEFFSNTRSQQLFLNQKNCTKAVKKIKNKNKNKSQKL
jgi:hypothetical protein